MCVELTTGIEPVTSSASRPRWSRRSSPQTVTVGGVVLREPRQVVVFYDVTWPVWKWSARAPRPNTNADARRRARADEAVRTVVGRMECCHCHRSLRASIAASPSAKTTAGGVHIGVACGNRPSGSAPGPGSLAEDVQPASAGRPDGWRKGPPAGSPTERPAGSSNGFPTSASTRSWMRRCLRRWGL